MIVTVTGAGRRSRDAGAVERHGVVAPDALWRRGQRLLVCDCIINRPDEGRVATQYKRIPRASSDKGVHIGAVRRAVRCATIGPKSRAHIARRVGSHREGTSDDIAGSKGKRLVEGRYSGKSPARLAARYRPA